MPIRTQCFKELLKDECHVSRTEHIITGERRCTYTLTLIAVSQC